MSDRHHHKPTAEELARSQHASPLDLEQYNALFLQLQNEYRAGYPALMDLVLGYLQVDPTGGTLHAALDDGNLGDDNLWYGEGWADGIGDQWASDIARLLRLIPLSHRYRCYESSWTWTGQ